ncbi:hypothetical protein [Alkaliphilus oremlandii]|uniref:Uncharacterized protein n=1 Tax=Alkaliphilus oremlandii (strain OhILAs) TaxID=350688 RepID=A8MFP7_ALKOO|nr:hypothetical protein [Alkaliphilus oremlandii]ABW17686.1 hypothetical protein Clos_0119 [Alkaliphilus oremlandii OhILAs]
MEDLYKNIEMFFEKLPISRNNMALKKAFIEEIDAEYEELKKENTEEESIRILKNEHQFIYEVNKMDGTPGLYLYSKGLTISDVGLVFDPSENEERFERAYQLLKELCDIDLCYQREKEDFKFDPSERLIIFALDRDRNYFGFIGDSGNLGESNIPIAYIRKEGIYGKVANNLKELLELALFYPYWYEFIQLRSSDKEYSLEMLERQWIQETPDFYEKQKELANALGINKNDHSLDILIENLRQKPSFIVSDLADDFHQFKYILGAFEEE